MLRRAANEYLWLGDGVPFPNDELQIVHGETDFTCQSLSWNNFIDVISNLNL